MSARPNALAVERRHRIKLLNEEVADYYGHFRVTPDLIES
jgi:hypothetical protein